MKKYILIIFALLLVTTCVNAYKVPSSGITTPSALNVRTGPSTSYTVLQTIPAGTVVEILEMVGKWYQVNVAGRNGVYVYSSYVKITEYTDRDDPEAEKNATKRFMPTLATVDASTR